jgi:xanthine dehydrogenase accessory factor
MSRDVTERLLAAIEGNERAVVFTVIEGERLGSKALVLESGEQLGDGVPAAALEQANELIRGARSRVVEVEDARVFADVYGPPPRLVIIGAVDTADALCAAAKLLGWETIVADARGKFTTAERIPHADRLIVEWPEEALAEVQPDHATAIVVLTHDDKFDIPARKAALATEAFYVGALGSRRNQERRRELLLEAGVDESAVERISGPAGLDIGAHTPAETGVSILAEILAVRAGRDGGRLKESSGRIHAEVGL